MKRIAALDLGSGTIKLSAFVGREVEQPLMSGLLRPGSRTVGWSALTLTEANTELRRGMGPELTLKPGPIADTLAAAKGFLAQARELGVENLPAYATSAVRRCKNPEALLVPLRELGIEAKVLSEDEEGRLNLLGAARRLDFVAGLETPPAPQSRLSNSLGDVLVLDPGGDSTECCGGSDWRMARVASLPLGSVSLQEAFGSADDNLPIAWERLVAARAYATRAALGHPQFGAFVGQGLMPAIRMNAPIQRALELLNGRAPAQHGQGGTYSVVELEKLCQRLACLDHSARAQLLDGEPIGKVDRTCYGFASWLGILDALGAQQFLAEPWGIKLGAALFLNGYVNG